jgi:two-component system, cell cycle response regulator DivK
VAKVSHLPPSLILLAEPSPVEREMYSEYLSWSGFQVEVCEDGDAAFERALVVHPDVVCASFVMSAGSGAELCAALHADRRTSTIPVIILTTLTSDLEMEAARASGCEALLVKPCLPERLRAEAKRLITQSRRSQHGARSGHPASRTRSSHR